MNRHIDGRLRVSGGYDHPSPFHFVILALLVLCSFAAAFAEESSYPKKLVFANTATWDASIEVQAGDAPLDYDPAICAIGPSSARVKLPVGGANVLRNPALCVNGFALIPAPADPAAAAAILSFDDGTTASSFTVPALGALHGDVGYTFRRPCISDGVESCYVTLVPTYDGTPLYVELQDARSLVFLPVVEKIKASLPVTQYEIQADGVFWITLKVGTDPTYRCFPAKSCEVYGAVYPFLANGTNRGGSLRVSVVEE